MGKVIVTIQLSADASIGPDLGWMDRPEPEAEIDVRLADAMLLGRKTYEQLSKIWPKTPGELAERVNGMPKYVASTTLTEPLEWNASLIKGDLATEVRKLKDKYEGELRVDGCGEFAFNMVQLDLVDEVQFWVHPVVWEEPARPFHGLGHIKMELQSSTAFRSGVVRNIYHPVSVEK